MIFTLMDKVVFFLCRQDISLELANNDVVHLPPKKLHRQSDVTAEHKSAVGTQEREKEILEEFELGFGDELEAMEEEEHENRDAQPWTTGADGGIGVKRKNNGEDPNSDLSTGASFRRGAELILRREGKPMDAREIVRVGLKEGMAAY